MPITIGSKRESDFTDPIGMLGNCHRRIERFLNVLVTLATGEKGGLLTEEHRAALETSLRYFREAAPKHTADEEESLFPRLRRIDVTKTQAILAASTPWSKTTSAPGGPMTRWTNWDNVGSPLAGFYPKTHPGCPPCSISWQSSIAITSP
jgi:hypothetical protein